MIYSPEIAAAIQSVHHTPLSAQTLMEPTIACGLQRALEKVSANIMLLIEHGESVLCTPQNAIAALGPQCTGKLRKGGPTPWALLTSQHTQLSLQNTYSALQAFRAEGLCAAWRNLPFTSTDLPIALDPGLSETGRRQAQNIAHCLASIRQNFQTVRMLHPHFSSPLRRPLETAEHAGLDIPEHNVLWELMERIMVPQHGLTQSEIANMYPDIHAAMQSGTEIVHPHIEPMDVFSDRFESGLLRMLTDIEGTGNIAIGVTHQTPIKVVTHAVSSTENRPSNMFDIHVPNGSITIIAVRRVARQHIRTVAASHYFDSPFFLDWSHSAPDNEIEGALLSAIHME